MLHKEAFAFGVLCESFILFLQNDQLRQKLMESNIIPHLLNNLSIIYFYGSLAMGMIDVTEECLEDSNLYSFVDYLMESGLISFLLSQTKSFYDHRLRLGMDNLFKQLVGFKSEYYKTFFQTAVGFTEEYLNQLKKVLPKRRGRSSAANAPPKRKTPRAKDLVVSQVWYC
jgi:hypothetical protein